MFVGDWAESGAKVDVLGHCHDENGYFLSLQPADMLQALCRPPPILTMQASLPAARWPRKGDPLWTRPADNSSETTETSLLAVGS